jgi:hypothetical protein
VTKHKSKCDSNHAEDHKKAAWTFEKVYVEKASVIVRCSYKTNPI